MSGSWALPEELRLLAESDEGLVKEVLTVFLSDTGDRIGRLRAALDRGDRAMLKNEAHAIKGSAGQVGAAAVSGVCRQLEQQATAMDMPALRDLVAQIETAFASVCRDMSVQL